MTEDTEDSMHIDQTRAATLNHALGIVLTNVERAVSTTRAPSTSTTKARHVRLVAVSKLKPANDILALYRAPHNQRHFGENYQQELLEKSQILPRDIRWHFIGALQTNKCRPLAQEIPNLWCVESVDTVKKADQLEKGRQACQAATSTGTSSTTAVGDGDADQNPRLRVFVQVNTSGEAEKSGVDPTECSALCHHIIQSCPHLHLQGLMTIGAIARSQAIGARARTRVHKEDKARAGAGEVEGNQDYEDEEENEDFMTLRTTRDHVCKELNIPHDRLELSMGMSEDYENAIMAGSDEVRVGSTIFGQRPQRQDAKLTEDDAKEATS